MRRAGVARTSDPGYFVNQRTSAPLKYCSLSFAMPLGSAHAPQQLTLSKRPHQVRRGRAPLPSQALCPLPGPRIERRKRRCYKRGIVQARLLMTNDSFRSSGFAAFCERLGAGDAFDRAFRAGGANCHPQLAQGCGSLAAQRSVAHPHRRGLTIATRDHWRLAPEPSVAGGRKPVWRVKYSLARHLPRCDSDLHGSGGALGTGTRSIMLLPAIISGRTVTR